MNLAHVVIGGTALWVPWSETPGGRIKVGMIAADSQEAGEALLAVHEAGTATTMEDVRRQLGVATDGAEGIRVTALSEEERTLVGLQILDRLLKRPTRTDA